MSNSQSIQPEFLGQYFSGFLLGTSGSIPIKKIPHLDKAHRYFRTSVYTPPKGWWSFVLHSRTPLADEEVGDKSYYYPMLFYPTRNRVLVLSRSRMVIEHCCEFQFVELGLSDLSPVNIKVDSFIKSLQHDPDSYQISYLSAEVISEDASLRHMHLHGDSILDSPIYLEYEDKLVGLACGIRYAGRMKEVIRVGTDGNVSFYHVGEQRLEDVIAVLREINNRGLIAD